MSFSSENWSSSFSECSLKGGGDNCVGPVVGAGGNLTGADIIAWGAAECRPARAGSSCRRRRADDHAVGPRPGDPDVELLVDRFVEVLELAEDHDRRLEPLEAADRREVDILAELAPLAGQRRNRPARPLARPGSSPSRAPRARRRPAAESPRCRRGARSPWRPCRAGRGCGSARRARPGGPRTSGTIWPS